MGVEGGGPGGDHAQPRVVAAPARGPARALPAAGAGARAPRDERRLPPPSRSGLGVLPSPARGAILSVSHLKAGAFPSCA